MDATERLARFLLRRPDLVPGLGVNDLRLLVSGEGSSGDVWIAEVRGRPVAIIRRCEIRRAARRLVWAHGLAERIGRAPRRPVPRLLGADLSWWRTRRVGGPVISEEFIEGRSLAWWPPEERREFAPAVARALAALHTVRSPTWGGFGERPKRDFGRKLNRMIAHRLDFLRHRRERLQGAFDLDRLAGWLTSTVQALPRYGDYALVHNHVAADDLVVRPDGEVALVDIGSLQFGPPEPDLVAALHALGLAEGDPAPLLEPYLATRPPAERDAIVRRLLFFRVFYDVSRLRACLRRERAGQMVEAIAPIVDRLGRLIQRPFS